MSKRKNDSFLASAARYTAVAMALPGSIVAGWLVGYWLDVWARTRFFRLIFLLVGVAAGFVPIIRQLQRDMKDK